MNERTRTLLSRLAGIALFALGVAVASHSTPEWKVRLTPPPDEAKAKFDEVARLAGYEPATEARKLALKFSGTSDISIRTEAADQLGTEGREWIDARGLGLLATVDAQVRDASGAEGTLNVATDMRGNVVAIEHTTLDFSNFVKPGKSEIEPESWRETASILLRPGETLGEPERAPLGGQTIAIFPITGTSPAESITVTEPPGIRLLNRRPGSPEDLKSYYDRVLTISNMVTRGVAALIRFVVFAFFAGLFIALVVKRSIGLRTALMLGALAFLAGTAGSLTEVATGWMFWMRLFLVLLTATWCLVVWSGAESWLRTVRPAMLRTLDSVASFRPGPKSGSAIIDGWFAGFGLAGLLLLLDSAPTVVGMVSSSSASFSLPVFGVLTPISRAVFLSAGILAAAAAAQYVAERHQTVIAIVLMTIAITPLFQLSHWSLTILTAFVASIVLRSLLVRGGAAAVLSATLILLSAPSALFALRHLDWMPYSALGSGAIVLAPVFFAVVGLRQPANDETQQIATPRFMRRLSEERRVQYEMGLLAEMQMKMLPDTAPQLEGWDIAGHSVIASEVGGDLYDYLEDDAGNLWIAIGDVSGHGYQCAIAQAMTKASLTSLVSADHAPSVLLERIDKVLRRGGSSRTFTSLALAKLEPSTGRVTLSNAGNPYPVHVTADGRVHEIELPSLPLGMGPPRSYTDVKLQLGHRDYLLFYSDGLVEVRNRNDEMLGFEKPAALVRMRRGQTAAEIVGGLEKTWRDHLGEHDVQDDTTIVVVRRL